MTTRGVNENDWVAFEGDVKFQPSSRRRKRRSRSQGRTKARSDASPVPSSGSKSTASWMNQPINDEASWMPLAPPKNRVTSRERPCPEDNRSLRSDSGTSSGASDPTSSTTCSSSSISAGHPPIRIPPRLPRGRKPLRTTSMSEIDVREKPVLTSSERSARGRSTQRMEQRARGRSTERLKRVEHQTRGRASERHPRVRPESSPRRGRSRMRRDSVKSAGSGRGRSSSRNEAESFVRRGRSRGRSSSRTLAGSSPSSRRTSSSNRMRVTSPNRLSTARHRSLSRPRSETSRPPLTSSPHVVASRELASNSIGPGYISAPIHPTRASLTNNSDRISTSEHGKPPRGRIMERLFGDVVPDSAKKAYLPERSLYSSDVRRETSATAPPERTYPRILLSATVYHNTATNLWIATINTNQKGVATNPTTAAKYLKAFTFATEQEAREAAIANAPPKMVPFAGAPSCFICQGKFAMFRRASHCRNCGACVCSSCTTTWPHKSLPDNYNLKNEGNLKVCKSCNYLTHTFKEALLQGNYDQAVSLYRTGNLNLRCPFPPSKGEKKTEQMYPIHCAVEGGNLDIVRWLMEDHFCPIKVVQRSNGKSQKKKDIPILTSKGRSVLGIAMSGLKVDILRYLVVDKGVSVYAMKDLKTSLQALEAVLLAFPVRADEDSRHGPEIVIPRWDSENYSDGSFVCSSLGDDQSLPSLPEPDYPVDTPDEIADDACILCYANAIDCVVMPCGHQLCCMECSTNITKCPVCSVECSFIRVFKP